ncbi:MAG: acyl carrier protein [Deltaproteobacteria bacterium]|nr:acyl carrier protein [Deltaproteobacteria bacterium]
MTDRAGVRESVVTQIALELGIELEVVRGAGSLRKEIGMDSVAAANILFALEARYGVEVDLDGALSVDSVEDVVELLLAAMSCTR